MEADMPAGCVAPIVTDKEFLLRLLSREDEVAQAKRPGQGRRENLQCMREAAEILGPTTPWSARREDPSAYGAKDHERQAALAHHRALLDKLREEAQPTEARDKPPDEMLGNRSQEERVEIVDEEDETMRFNDPVRR